MSSSAAAIAATIASVVRPASAAAAPLASGSGSAATGAVLLLSITVLATIPSLRRLRSALTHSTICALSSVCGTSISLLSSARENGSVASVSRCRSMTERSHTTPLGSMTGSRMISLQMGSMNSSGASSGSARASRHACTAACTPMSSARCTCSGFDELELELELMPCRYSRHGRIESPRAVASASATVSSDLSCRAAMCSVTRMLVTGPKMPCRLILPSCGVSRASVSLKSAAPLPTVVRVSTNARTSANRPSDSEQPSSSPRNTFGDSMHTTSSRHNRLTLSSYMMLHLRINCGCCAIDVTDAPRTPAVRPPPPAAPSPLCLLPSPPLPPPPCRARPASPMTPGTAGKWDCRAACRASASSISETWNSLAVQLSVLSARSMNAASVSGLASSSRSAAR
mmetsp:Transcript_17497/g.54226  ORF Transcript_17497/g.54226 Transcript_17497/m.54226 type:complete len:400 (+) Transcript_17497:45-1244(+)